MKFYQYAYTGNKHLLWSNFCFCFDFGTGGMWIHSWKKLLLNIFLYLFWNLSCSYFQEIGVLNFHYWFINVCYFTRMELFGKVTLKQISFTTLIISSFPLNSRSYNSSHIIQIIGLYNDNQLKFSKRFVG